MRNLLLKRVTSDGVECVRSPFRYPPSGSSGTCYPSTKDQKVGGWRLDEQGYTTKRLAYNMQIQENTKGVSVSNAMLRDVKMTMVSFMQGLRGASVIMVHLSSHGVKHGTITEELIRQALHAAVDADPRIIYVTHDGKCITDLEAFITGEEKLAPKRRKGEKRSVSGFLPDYRTLPLHRGRIELYCHGILKSKLLLPVTLYTYHIGPLSQFVLIYQPRVSAR